MAKYGNMETKSLNIKILRYELDAAYFSPKSAMTTSDENTKQKSNIGAMIVALFLTALT